MHVDTAIVEPLLTLLSYDNYRIKPENVIKLSIQKHQAIYQLILNLIMMCCC